MRIRERGFTLIELLTAVGITTILAALATGAGWKVYESSSLAVSASNIRQLAAGGSAYLGDHDLTFWRYRENVAGQGVKWWYGFEATGSLSKPEGERTFDATRGPLGPYIPAGVRPDPSFSFTGKAFKPKYRSGYIGTGYNVLLADDQFRAMVGWMGAGERPARLWQLEDPSRTVVFATSGQVNTFQKPASPKNPMVEEFYGIDTLNPTVHGRHRGKAMVAYASGNVDFVELAESTLDRRAPEAKIGRFIGNDVLLK